ncbi:metal-dependent hydrolase [Candidatus Dependentiae bacterium]|nr:metal-dependent hydrolase [Candidatus Dependentiae bacterium]
MPTYKGHLAGGGVTFLAIHLVTTKLLNQPTPPPNQILFTLEFCLLGSLFPDIDTKSFGQKIFYYLLTAMILAAIYTQQWGLLSILSLISVFPLLVNHRGIIHTIWFVTLAPLAIPLIIQQNNPLLAKTAWFAYLYFEIGALSHLFLDYGFLRTAKKVFSKR